MHNRSHTAAPTLATVDRTDATMTSIVGYAGLLLWLSVAAAMWGVRRTRRSTPHTTGHLWTRLTIYALTLAALYPVATLNRLVIERPGDGALVAFSLVALNAAVWCVVLCEAVAWFTRYDGNPPHWNVYDVFSRLVCVCVTVIAGGALSSESSRFVSLLAVAPLAAALVWTATAEAGTGRSIAQPPFSADTLEGAMPRPRIAFVTLAFVGFSSFILEMLAPSYGNVVGVGMAAVFMLSEHALALIPLLLMATAPDMVGSRPASRTSSPVVPRDDAHLHPAASTSTPQLPSPTFAATAHEATASLIGDWPHSD